MSNQPEDRAPTLGERLRSIAYALAFYGGSVVMGFIVWVALAVPGRRATTFWCEAWSGWQRWCTLHILGCKLVIEGEIPQGACLVAIKHESMFEAVDIPTLLPFPGVFAKVELLSVPAWGKAGRRYGVVSVERDQGAKALRAMVSAARELAAENRPLAIFPEGTRVHHGDQPPLQSGFAGLYKLIGLPVVPVAVNSGPLCRSFWKKRGTITYRFGETIPTGLPREEIEARVHAAINALNNYRPPHERYCGFHHRRHHRQGVFRRAFGVSGGRNGGGACICRRAGGAIGARDRAFAQGQP